MTNLAEHAAALVAPGKGILAADESIGTMSARLTAAGVEASEENRRAYREMLVTTPDLATGIGGVILCDETLRQRVSGGATFPQALAERGIQAGIKVDTGARPLPGAPGETITEGLDGLGPRLAEYAGLGATFAKWRAVLKIGPGTPSPVAVRANAQALARYASACQEAGLVPIVEPEVLMDGEHSLALCQSVTTLVLLALMTELEEYGVRADGAVLKPNMVTPGRDSGEQAEPDQVAAATLAALAALPDALAGVAFLSGGQPPERATANLAAMQALPHPWPLTFSFGRALVDPALRAWHGDPACWSDGQWALARRVALNVAAVSGDYQPELELSPA
ncbi:MAG: class I fructose-bisphosphate aldolase [Streptosporangiaceae bacterium]